MRTALHRTIGVALAALSLAATAQAQGKGHGKNHGKGQGDRDQRVDVVESHRGDRSDIDDDRRKGDRSDIYDDRRKGDRSDIYDDQDKRDRVPPGLAKKPGHMPPGQYKKRYGTRQGASVLGDIMRQRGYSVTRIVPTGSAQNVYYRTANGAEQLAIVGLGTDRLLFRNVPAALLQEVLARLY